MEAEAREGKQNKEYNLKRKEAKLLTIAEG